MRGLIKATNAASSAQARRDYAWLLNLAAQHGVADSIPTVSDRAGWRMFDKAAKEGARNLLLARPELAGVLAGVYPGFATVKGETK